MQISSKPWLGGVLHCDACGHEHKAVASKLGHLWLATGLQCERCGLSSCYWLDEKHFSGDEEATTYARSLSVNVVESHPDGAA